MNETSGKETPYHIEGDDHASLVGPGGFVCRLGEPEDCLWSRDGQEAVDELNALADRYDELAREMVRLEQARQVEDAEYDAKYDELRRLAAAALDACRCSVTWHEGGVLVNPKDALRAHLKETETP